MDFSIKVVMVGAEKVGKSCLLSYLSNESFDHTYHPTIGADLRVLRREDVKVCLWDMAGSERFSNMLDSFIKSANIVLYCYTSGDNDTFRRAMEYHKQYKNISAKKILVATKCDSVKIDDYEIRQVYDSHGLDFVRTSSYKKIGRERLLDLIISPYILPRIPEENYRQDSIKKCCFIC